MKSDGEKTTLCCCVDSENLCQLTKTITEIIVASLERKLSLKLSNESIYGSTVLLHMLLAILPMILRYRRYALHYNSFVLRYVSRVRTKPNKHEYQGIKLTSNKFQAGHVHATPQDNTSSPERSTSQLALTNL